MKCEGCGAAITEDADTGRHWSSEGPVCEKCVDDGIEFYGNHQYDDLGED